ncbi:MICOS complex subunit MIC27 isoform X1 [Brienomyrus brachyistius]|uniref:MICOS complex subunit MIC27 isoform X1 n=1 Tax=Brienomyrus brachyistius TaxID=42636 RepID=UPI0020B3CE86|nr:MICOS complex subunit MIC27 isoform X1 [Brienomyrus brachyistius]
MAAKVLKLSAIPAALGLASFRIYELNKEKTKGHVNSRELSIYTPTSQPFHFVEDQPGSMEKGLHTLRVGLQPYARAVKDACVSFKIGAVNLYYAGEDIYHYLKDPPPGFLPRVSLITVSGLAGLVLARKGSRLKRITMSLGLATLGTAVCYPGQTVKVLKITGRKTYAGTQWAVSTAASLWKANPAKEVPTQPVGVQSVSVSESPSEAPSTELTPETLPPQETHTVPAPLEESVPQLTPEPSCDPPPHPAEDRSPVEGLASVPPTPQKSDLPEALGQALDADAPADSSKTPQFSIDPKLMDHGQSNPEDADLYSTRS